MFERGLKFIVFLACILTACAPKPTPARVTPDYSIPYTMAAQTAHVQGTIQAGETAVAQLTQLAAAPTSPPSPPTQLPSYDIIPTLSPPTAVSPPASPTSAAAPCYQAQLVDDFNIPVNAVLPLGAAFTKTWQIRNTGSCPWTQQFSLVLSAGDPMGSKTIYLFSTNTMPGETLLLSIGLTAPGFVGVHQGNWLLRSDTGATFGLGINGATPLQILIRTVQSQAGSAIAYDFSTKFCQAAWESGAGSLGCPGTAGDARGSITLLDQPSLESRQASELALLTIPNTDISGWVRGKYPAYTIQQNDHFLSEIGCLNGSPNCRLVFQLSYQVGSGAVNRLGIWQEIFDGGSTTIDYDLSSLAGNTVQFIFFVQNTGSANHANAFWLQPRVQNLTSSGTLVLSWTRTGYPIYPCAELQVFLTGTGTGQAIAYTCTPTRRELGRAGLSSLDVQELLNWRLSLRGFDAEINRAMTSTSIVTWVKFYGTGANNATDSDIQAVNSFASSLFDSIAP